MAQDYDPLTEFTVDPGTRVPSSPQRLSWEDMTWLIHRNGVTHTLTSHEGHTDACEDDASSPSPASTASSDSHEDRSGTSSVPATPEPHAAVATTSDTQLPPTSGPTTDAKGRVAAGRLRQRHQPPMPALPTWTAKTTIEEAIADSAQSASRAHPPLQCFGGCRKSWA